MRTSLRLISTTFILAIFNLSTATVQAEDYTIRHQQRHDTNLELMPMRINAGKPKFEFWLG